MSPKWRVLCGGVLFALLQFSYFVELEWLLSSAWTTYATVVSAWLLGVMVGLEYAARSARSEAVTLITNLAAFYLLQWILYLRPFDNRLLPFYAAMILTSGAYAGSFMRTNFRRIKGARNLLLHENNGFLLGLIIGFLGYYYNGRIFPLASPAVCALVLLGADLAEAE